MFGWAHIALEPRRQFGLCARWASNMCTSSPAIGKSPCATSSQPYPFPEGPIFQNMLTRNMDDIPDMDLYVCGFPCTPFSSLRRHKTRLLKEAAAKPFLVLLKVLEERKPALAVLENVVGIETVMQKVCQMLGKLGCYFVIVVKIDSEALGVPLRRPRYYFILVRKDVPITKNIDSLASLGKAIMKGCTQPVRGTVLDLLLPPQRTQAKQMTVKKAGARRKHMLGRWEVRCSANGRQSTQLSGRSLPCRRQRLAKTAMHLD